MFTVPGFDLPHAWTTLEPTGRLVTALAMLGIGLVVAFFGFRLFRFVLLLTGAAFGAQLGLFLTRGAAWPAPLPPTLPAPAVDGLAASVTTIGTATVAVVSATSAAVANLAAAATTATTVTSANVPAAAVLAGGAPGTPLFEGGVAAWVVPIALALLGGALLWSLYRLGGLLFGVALGLGLLGSIGTVSAAATDARWLLLLVGAIGGALLGWWLQTLTLILTTALAGGWTAVGATYLLLHLADPSAATTFTAWCAGPLPQRGAEAFTYLVGALALALIGTVFQARDHARRRGRRA